MRKFADQESLSQSIIGLSTYPNDTNTYPIFLVSGYSWPLEEMPDAFKLISQLFPTTPFLDAYIKITVMEGTLSDVYQQVLHLLALTAIGWLVFSARIVYWKEKGKE